MFIKQLILNNFRSFENQSFDFPNATVVIEGNNGVGKTNILESIFFLCTGKSQRKAKKKDMVKDTKNFFLSKVFLNITIHQMI